MEAPPRLSEGNWARAHVAAQPGCTIWLMSAAVRITLAAPGTDQLAQVVRLADRNAKFLGHFPASCFQREAERQRVIIAVGPDGLVWGFVLYRTTLDRAVVQQLCVDECHRKAGVGRALVSDLKQRTRHLPSIICHCALEYSESIAAWQRFGFVPMGEKKGRGQSQRPLLRLVYDHQHPTLFTQPAIESIIAVMDTNVALAVVNNVNDAGAGVLRADWLREEVSLRVVDEVLSEAARQANHRMRQLHMARLRSLPGVARDHEREAGFLAALAATLGAPARLQDECDRRQLAQAAAGGADVFLTRDKGILDHREDVRRVLGLRIMHPIEFIVSLDEVSNSSAYAPCALHGTAITIRRPGAGELDDLVVTFLNYGSGEKRSRLAGEVGDALLSDLASVHMVSDRGRVAALRAVRRDADLSRVTLLRVGRDSLAETVTRHLLHDTVRASVATGQGLTVIQDASPLVPLDNSASACGFVRAGSVWLKWSRPGLHTRASVAIDLDRAAVRHAELAPQIQQLASSIRGAPDAEVERLIWPGLLRDSSLLSFVVPIQPRWAEHLFDAELASRGMFGGDPSLLLNTENVYYRSARGDFPTGSRLFWYVSSGHGDKVQELRARSSVVGCHVGSAKHLYTRFRRLGVYRWQDVLGAAHGSPEGDVMAIHFGPTERLPKAVAGDLLRSILSVDRGRGKIPMLAGPELLSGACVEQICEAAYGG